MPLRGIILKPSPCCTRTPDSSTSFCPSNSISLSLFSSIIYALSLPYKIKKNHDFQKRKIKISINNEINAMMTKIFQITESFTMISITSSVPTSS